MMVIPETWRAH